tara:strand:+ start:10359 stop:12911 length:2553 start_codon:yes stop_codon:yes gene_type:complete
MSVINLKGNTVANTGKYLPAPYIDKIELLGGGDTEEATFTVDTSVFTVNHIDRWSYDGTKALPDETAYANSLENELNYYVMVFMNADPEAAMMPDVDPTTGISFYESVLNGVNPFVMYYDSGSLIHPDWPSFIPGADNGPVVLRQIFPFNSSPESGYNQQGQNILKFSAEQELFDIKDIVLHLSDPVSWTSPDLWDICESLKVITFSSTYDYFSNVGSFEEKKNNLPLLQLATSELSHENVIEGGTLAPAAQTIYSDSTGAVYEEVPLVSIDLAPHKIGRITHEQVVDKFQGLLDNYQSYYDTEDKYHKLKNIMDNVATVLATHGESENILPQLNQIAKTYPDKAPIRPIGKFYKSFRKRIFAVNKAIKSGEKLRRKILYSSKISDHRELPDLTSLELLHDTDFNEETGASLGDTYIYTNWTYSNYSPHTEDSYSESMSGVVVQPRVVFGHYFFDYEKALRRVSNVSSVFRIDKLIDVFGLQIPYTLFHVNGSWVFRQYQLDGGGASRMSAATIGTTMVSNRPYPRSEYTHIRDFYNNDDVPWPAVAISPKGNHEVNVSEAIAVWAFENTPYSEFDPEQDVRLGASDGLATSLVYREFLDIGSYPNSYVHAYGPSPIENYRMMCFELLDYQMSCYGENEGYSTYISVTDSTLNVINDLTSSCRSALNSGREYLATAHEACAVNDTTLEFNKYFRDSVIAEYKDKIEEAPWYQAPLIYVMHIDLLYNTFGGDRAAIVDKATEISQQIGPINGTLSNLEGFIGTFTNMLNSAYGASPGEGATGAKIAEMEAHKDMVFRTQLSPDGLSITYETADFMAMPAEATEYLPRPDPGLEAPRDTLIEELDFGADDDM